MSDLALNCEASEKLITHSKSTIPSLDLSNISETLRQKRNLSLPLEGALQLLEQLAQFELGRFLLINKGLNGHWTSYIIIHGPKRENLSPLETWILHYAPTVKATQERFKVFQNVLQNNLRDGLKIASIPCGLMDDLLLLDYTHTKNVCLIGIDLDPQSLTLAKENAKNYGLTNVQFYQKDAWKLDVHEEYDAITSNGLNVYESDDKKVIALYKQFYKALTPGGILITSFLTPPPALSEESTWKYVNPEDAIKQKAIFNDIIGATWQSFRTEIKTKEQLETAGFQVLEVIYDSQGIFPTVVAKKKPCPKHA